MVWYSSSDCQGNRDWKCTYESPESGDQWCRDVSGEGCPSIDDGGYLLDAQSTHTGGGW